MSKPVYDDDPLKCVCFRWARICTKHGDLTLHHERCPMYDAEEVKRTEKALRDTAWQITNDR